ncbi:MAG: phosphoglycerate kinase [Minisyncoccia bacterium]
MHYLSAQNLKKMSGRTCLLRIDLNIEPGAPLDSYRLQAVVPTIKLLLKNRIRVIILSHRGRPKGTDKKLSLRPFAPIIAKKISHHVDFCEPGEVVLFENLRFLPGEEKNDAKLAKKLASLGDFYVNDAFAVSHRANASVAAITRFLPSYGGLLLEKEIKNLDRAMKKPVRPFVIILGGAKLKEKIVGLSKLIEKSDATLLGSNVFNESGIPKSPKFIWPKDAMNYGKFIWDIGPFTLERYASIIGKARTIVWNGPPGFFEKKDFRKGTIGIWKAVLKNKKAYIVIGGGETSASLELLGKPKIPKNIFISTGGGAMLEYLSGKRLPGIEALK